MKELISVAGENIKNVFSKPDLYAEKGEFERVANTFNIDSSVLLWAAEQGKMVTLNEDIWSVLQNSDSFSLHKDDHEAAQTLANFAERNYHEVAEALYAGVAAEKPISAPIVMKYDDDQYHLVSGNTRLMVARAYGVTPKVWLFEVDSNAN